MKCTKKGKNDDSCLSAYFEQIKKIPILTFEEELELSRRIQAGDTAARKRLIESNLRLVVKIARAYLANDLAYMDLIQDGNIGLMRAAEKYDHRKQVRFSTYAVLWIRQAITRSLEEKRRPIRLPRGKEDIFRKIQKANNALSQTYMREPNSAEIAAAIRVPLGEVQSILEVTQVISSVENSGDYTYNPERDLIKKSSRQAVNRVLNKLDKRERNILISRYQLNGGKRHSLRKIGDRMGISVETVRQTEFRALRKLRGHAEELRYHIEAM